MNGAGDAHSISPLSVALVVAQVALIALLASPLDAFVPSSVASLSGLLLLVGGLGLALAAAAAMRASRFSVLPEPRSGGTLVEHGPYRLVRHPMYSAVLVCGLGAAVAHGDGWHWLWLVLIALVLWWKVRREERLLLAAYPDYARYRERVGSLFPRPRRRRRGGTSTRCRDGAER